MLIILNYLYKYSWLYKGFQTWLRASDNLFFFFSFFPEVVEQIQKQITISPYEKSHHNPNSRYLPTVFVLVSKMTENLERGVLKESSFPFLPHFTLLSCCCQHRCTDSAFLWLPHILPASCQVTGRGPSASPKLAQWLGQNFCNLLNSEYRNQNLWADGKIATQGCVAFCGSIFFFSSQNRAMVCLQYIPQGYQTRKPSTKIINKKKSIISYVNIMYPLSISRDHYVQCAIQ